MLFPLLLAVLLLIAPNDALAQSEDDPLHEIVGQRIESANIFMLWQEEAGSGLGLSRQKMYTYDRTLSPEKRVVPIPGVSDGRPVAGNRQMVAASGNFNVDPYEDVVAAWEGEAQQIELLIPHFDTTDAMWNETSALTVAEPAAGTAADGTIRLKTGDLDGDGLDEFVLAYQDSQDRIRVQVYDTDGTLDPQLRAQNADEVVPVISGLEATPFDLAVGDVDGDGRDEIVQVGIDPAGGGENVWAMYWKVYRFDGNNLTVLARDTGYKEPTSFNFTIVHYAVESGRFRSGRPDELVFVWSFDRRYPAPNTVDDTFIYTLSYDSGTGTFVDNLSGGPDTRLEYNAVVSANDMDPLAISTADLNGDGLDEAVIGIEEKIFVVSVDAFVNLKLRSTFDHGGVFAASTDYLASGDIDQDGIAEIVHAMLYYDDGEDEERFVVQVVSAFDPGAGSEGEWRADGEVIGFIENDELIDLESKGFRRYAIAMGSFDGLTFRLGYPEHSVASSISQPLVILNAPPVHFDVFDEEIFDVNRCYSGGACAFKATYEKTSSTATEITTEVKKDWGVSIGAGYSGTVSGTPMGIGVSFELETYFDYKYGKNFSKEETEGETESITVEITASDDDVIYATVTDYDIWEYPVYHGTEDFPRRYIMVAVPHDPEGRWFPSKSWSGSAYIPDHEVGNVLSYPEYTDVSKNPNVDQSIRSINQSDTFVLGASPSYSWTLSRDSFNASNADTTKEVGFDSKLHAGVIRLSGDYTKSDISTHSTTVRKGLNLSVELGGIDRSFGETEYRVTPYAYWATNGALVVDYAVQAEVAASGGSDTWWDARYGSASDPAFILPWRYDPEKVFALGDESKRYQTADVIFDNPAPLPGDTLTLTARVRNFSLVSTPSPVTVHFYAGDPDDGGQLMVGTEGESSVSTSEAIPTRRWAEASMRWVVPANLGGSTRIYAVLDQEDAIPEIHTNNNKGYNIIQLSGSVARENPGVDGAIPEDLVLEDAYPNPFTESTVIPFSVRTSGPVTVEVFDVLGRRVELLEEGNLAPGRHQLTWHAGNHASGIYFVVVRGNDAFRTGRLVLMR